MQQSEYRFNEQQMQHARRIFGHWGTEHGKMFGYYSSMCFYAGVMAGMAVTLIAVMMLGLTWTSLLILAAGIGVGIWRCYQAGQKQREHRQNALDIAITAPEPTRFLLYGPFDGEVMPDNQVR